MRTIEAPKAAGLRDEVKAMVGSALVTEAYAQKIGADGYRPGASAAVRQAQVLTGNRQRAPGGVAAINKLTFRLGCTAPPAIASPLKTR